MIIDHVEDEDVDGNGVVDDGGYAEAPTDRGSHEDSWKWS